MLQKKYKYPSKTNDQEDQNYIFDGNKRCRMNNYVLKLLTNDNKYIIDKVFQKLARWYIYNVIDNSKSYLYYFKNINKNDYAKICLISWIYKNYNLYKFYDYYGAPSYEFTHIGNISLVVVDDTLINIFDGYYSLLSIFKYIVSDFWFSFELNKSKFIEFKIKYDRHLEYLKESKINKERKLLENEIRNTIDNAIDINYKNEEDLISLFSQIRIFHNFTVDELFNQLGIYSNIHLDITNYGQLYIKEILDNAERLFYQKQPRRWIIGICYNQNRRYQFLTYKYGGNKSVVNKIKEMLEKENKKKKQIASELQVSIKLLSIIMKAYKIKLPYREYSPEEQQLKSKIERILEEIFHKYNICHELYFRFFNKSNFINSTRKFYETDWLITINGIKCIIELYTNKRDANSKDAKEKILFYKTLTDNKLIVFFKEDLKNEEYIIQTIEQVMNVRIQRYNKERSL